MICRFSKAAFVALALFVLATGCEQSNRPATHPVRGTIVYRGKPVAGASVAFLAPGAPRLAVGTTDDAGRFSLTTYEPDDGAVLGTHVVTVQKLAMQPGPSYEVPGDGKFDNAAIERAMQEAAMRVEAAEKAGSELPARYANHNTSDLRLEVVEGENDFKIELGD
jgi:hypothetical protein